MKRVFDVTIRGTMRVEADSEEKAIEIASGLPEQHWDWDVPEAEDHDE